MDDDAIGRYNAEVRESISNRNRVFGATVGMLVGMGVCVYSAFTSPELHLESLPLTEYSTNFGFNLLFSAIGLATGDFFTASRLGAGAYDSLLLNAREERSGDS